MASNQETNTHEAGALAALERFVIENDDLLQLESLIGTFNIFDALRIARAEIRHSNFLAFILDPAESHGLGQLFLKALLMDLLKNTPPEMRPISPIELDGTELRGVEVRREWEHIDLFFSCQEPRFIVVVENKVGSKEGVEQLRRYETKVTKHFPQDKPLYVYLTPEGDEPSEESWISYSYGNIYDVFSRVRKTNEGAIGEDVLVFLDHYLNLIGTQFKNDPVIDELCQRIYKNHRQAVDLIYERAGSPSSGLLNEVESVMDEHQRWRVFHRAPKVIDFVPKDWADWLPPWSTRSEPRAWIFIRLHVFEDRSTCQLAFSPMKEMQKRKSIAEALLGRVEDLGFKRGGGKKIKNNYSAVSAPTTIFRWQEDSEPDADTFRQAVEKVLDDIHPKLEKLGVILRPLVERFSTES